MLNAILNAFRSKTSFRVAAAASLPSLLFLIMIGSFSYWQIYESTYNQVKASLEYDGRVDARRVGETFNTIASTIKTLSDNSTIANGLIDSAGRETYLTPLLEGFSTIHGVTFDLLLTDFLGTIIAYSGNGTRIDPFRELIAEAIEKGKSAYYIKEIGEKKYLLGIDVLVYSRTSSGEGALVYFVNLDSIFSNLIDGKKQKSSQLIYDVKGVENTLNNAIDTKNVKGVTHIVSPVPVLASMSELGIAIDQEIKLDELFSPLKRISLLFIMGSIICFVIIIFISLWLGRQITQPLKTLENSAVNLLISSDTVPSTLLVRRDEIGSLAVSFDSVISELRGMNYTLENKVEERTRELQLAKEQADNANMAKTSFLSSMSHELRTPLTAILGFGQMLELVSDEKLIKEKKKYVGEIMQAGKQLLALIDQVLQLSQIEVGKLSLNLEKVSVREIVDECFSMNRSLAASSDVELIDQTKISDYPLLCTDSIRLKQVLNNLISNAIKYNRKDGDVTVSCQQLPDNMLRISVKDIGEGVHEDQHDKLFMPFERLGRESGSIEGTGIGLTITKQVVDLLGGRIGFESEQGKGSTFWVDIPISHPPEHGEKKSEQDATAIDQFKSDEPKKNDEPNCTVLYIEDNVQCIKQVQSACEHKNNIRLLTATDAEHGFELALSDIPDVILLDIDLPEINGFEALAAIKVRQELQRIPVIAISAEAMPASNEDGMKAGFSAYATKPVDGDKLVRLITQTVSANKYLS